MYKHDTKDVWEAIGVDEKKLLKKLGTISVDCIRKGKKPSEKIEKMANSFSRKELSAITIMMEYKIRNMKEKIKRESLIGYE